MRNLLTDIPGVMVGHATDLALGSGVTAILFDPPAIASVCVLGGAPGGHDTTLLEPEMTVEKVDSVVLSGGAAFGLSAASGVQAWLRGLGRGVAVGAARVPIVVQAILFDLLNGGDKDWGRYPPYRELGWQAAEAARSGAFALGSVGAGTGATTATFKGGIGSASSETETGYRVAALVAVNAVGAASLSDGPHFWSAPFERDGEFGGIGWPSPMPADALTPRLKGAAPPPETGTTIGLIVTDAPLTKAQAKRLAIAGQDGLVRAIMPAHLPFDGDTIFAASTGEGPAVDPMVLTLLCHHAALTLSRAIARGVFEATALPYPDAKPAWRDRFSTMPRNPAPG
ncbi:MULTISPECIES: P1 family peptidase [unclassified Acidisoma]|jgi:L-aminopeptidase/D-esterase-like protein|uniref:P1 family peptidase n=1 Tax=unclassified Acidisoma TaxID=2634065 RepID=UPI00131AA3BE|nr:MULTISPECIES: P1 family peptidase [unclassified Acidisoma]